MSLETVLRSIFSAFFLASVIRISTPIIFPAMGGPGDHVHDAGHGLTLVNQDALVLLGLQFLAQVDILQVQAPLFRAQLTRLRRSSGTKGLERKWKAPALMVSTADWMVP